MNTKELVCYAARLADEKKAEQIKVLDLGGASSLCDYILIMTATSKPHLEAVEEEISKKLKELGYYKSNRDGAGSFEWRVSDYGGFLVHIMTQTARDYYSLDKIFSFGTEVDFTKPAIKKTAKKAATKKTTPKKGVAKKTVTKKTAKKAASKKTVKKATAKKPAARKTTSKTTPTTRNK